MLIILTGPPGAGKSTVGNILAYKFQRSVNFSLDDLRDFVKAGYVAPWNDTDEEGQCVLATDISIDMIKRYLAKNFVVIIDHVFDDADVTKYREYFDNVHAFLLLPTLDELHDRDAQRPPERQLGKRVDEVFADLTGEKHILFTMIDSTNQSPEETSEVIFKQLTTS